MSNPTYLCSKCRTFHPASPYYANHCPMCGNTEPNIELSLTDAELGIIVDVSKDPDFILAMSKLKEDDIIEFNIKLNQLKDNLNQSNNTPKCPTCGSTNIKKISATKRFVGTGLFGLASSTIGKNQECLDCGAKW